MKLKNERIMIIRKLKISFLKCDRIFYKLKFCTLGLVTLFCNNNNNKEENKNNDFAFSLSRQLFTGIWHALKLYQGSFPLSLYPFPLFISFPSLSLSLSPLSLSLPLSPSFSTVRAPNYVCVCVCVIIDVLCRVAFKPLSLCSFIIQFAGLF